MKLKCKRCKKEWEYRGKKQPAEYPIYVSCPDCKTSVKLENVKL